MKGAPLGQGQRGAAHGETATIWLQARVVDPLAQLDSPRVDVIVSTSARANNAELCCLSCRRPFALDFERLRHDSVSTSGIQSIPDGLQLSIRDAHDPSASWSRASGAKVALPACGETSACQLGCPHCGRGVALEFHRSLDDHSPHDLWPASKGTDGGKYAYATLLYGSGVEYVIGALVLGSNLEKPVLEPTQTSRYRRILLHTDDVPGEYLHMLSMFWELRRVDYLKGSATMYYDYGGSRFQEVFTKLQALSLVDFDKVLMLDNDLTVRRNIDNLFDLQAPAALKRPGGYDQPQHGQRFRASMLWKWRRLEKADSAQSIDVDGWRYDMMSGINAGVMLFRPDKAVYQRMLAEIRDDDHPEHLGCYGPEQEYLGRFFSAFGPGWTHMDSRYNYQPLLGRGANQFMRSLDAKREVAVAHFSGPRIKPWVGLAARDTRLGSETLRQLLCEDTAAFQTRFPENPSLPATGAEQWGERGYPTLVVGLIKEWTDALGCMATQMQKRNDLDIVAVVAVVERRQASLFRGGLHRLLRSNRRVFLCAALFGILGGAAGASALLRSFLRRRLRKSLSRSVGRALTPGA